MTYTTERAHVAVDHLEAYLGEGRLQLTARGLSADAYKVGLACSLCSIITDQQQQQQQQQQQHVILMYLCGVGSHCRKLQQYTHHVKLCRATCKYSALARGETP